MQSRTDVALFLPTLAGGGAEKTILRLAGEFTRLGLQVDVIVVRAEGALVRQTPDGVRLIDLHARRMIVSLPPLIHYLRRHQPRALLSTLELANLVAVLAKRMSGRPVRTIIRVPGTLSEYDPSNLKKRIERWLIARACTWADGVVAVSQAVANDLALNSGIGLERIAVIYNPVIPPDLKEKASQPVAHPFFQPGQPPVILGAGRLVEQKDFATLIRAFAIVREHQPTRLVILGEGEQRRKLEGLIEQLGLKAEASLPGFVDNPLAYMSKASVFVLSSLRETFGNVIVEAMACGSPVVCSDCPGGVAEAHAHGKYAAITPVRAPEEMAKTILRVLAGERPRVDPAWLQQFTLHESAFRYLSILGLAPERSFGNAGAGNRPPGGAGQVVASQPALSRPETTRRIPIHIGLFLPSLGGGGAEKALIHLASSFAHLGLRVDLVAVRAEGAYRRMIDPRVNMVNLQAGNAYSSLLWLYRYLRRERPDHLISTLDLTNLIALLARRGASVRTRCWIQVVNTVSKQRRTRLKKSLERLLMAHIYPWADGIIAVSQGVATDLASYAGIQAEKIHVIYSPILTQGLLSAAEAPAGHPRLNGEQIPVILSAGRLNAQKNFPLLLNAFARVRREREVRLIILGEGEERSRLVGLAEALGVSPDVDFPGFVQNPYAFMRKAAVFVLSSAWEGLPNVLVEAMACGCPVVSTDCPSGPVEILAGGRYGHLVPPGDVDSLAAAIEQVLAGDHRCPPAEWLTQFEPGQVARRYLQLMGVEPDLLKS